MSDVIDGISGESIYFTCVLVNIWSLVPKHKELYSFLIIKPIDCCYRCYQKKFDTFPNTVQFMLNIQ